MTAPVSLTLRFLMTWLLLLGTCAGFSAEEESEAPAQKEALYVKFHPDFIVNLKADRPQFLMVTI